MHECVCGGGGGGQGSKREAVCVYEERCMSVGGGMHESLAGNFAITFDPVNWRQF